MRTSASAGPVPVPPENSNRRVDAAAVLTDMREFVLHAALVTAVCDVAVLEQNVSVPDEIVADPAGHVRNVEVTSTVVVLVEVVLQGV